MQNRKKYLIFYTILIKIVVDLTIVQILAQLENYP